MQFSLWYVIVGVLLVAMAVADSLLRRLPLSTAMLYLLAGVALGPLGWGIIDIDPASRSALLERLAEVVVIVSLFAAGLKLRTPLDDGLWVIPVALATGSMAMTVGLITLVGWLGLGLPLGGAVLLGAVLAPTDPVLASDVQVSRPTDQDRLRFSLTGEAGLNDGTAFPFVMLGLGLLGLHDLGAGGWRWWAVDVGWAIGGGLAIGSLLGTLVGYFVVYLRREHKEAVGLDDFLALGLIALSYGVALLLHSYGFLAVFAAGLAVRRIERRSTGAENPPPDVDAAAQAADDESVETDPEMAPAFMAQAVLGYTEQLERIGTVGIVVLIGGMLLPGLFVPQLLWFIPVLLLVIRPIAVALLPYARELTRHQRALIAWLGIRGIGSIYYLMYAIEQGLPETLARRLTAITLWVVAVSVIVHGVSVTPLMRMYMARHDARADEQ